MNLRDVSITSQLTCLYHRCPEGISGAYAVYAKIHKKVRPPLDWSLGISAGRSFFAPLSHNTRADGSWIHNRHVVIIDTVLATRDLTWICRHALSLTFIDNHQESTSQVATLQHWASGGANIHVVFDLNCAMGHLVWNWVSPGTPYPTVIDAVASKTVIYQDLKEVCALESLAAFAEYDRAL